MSGDLIWAAVRLVVALPLVLGMAYLVLRYGLARRYVVTTGSRRMKLLEQLPLGPKTVLSLVTLGGRYYLLAHQDSSVSLIKELDDLPEPEESKVADILELTPRTVEEFDRLQKSGEAGGSGILTASPDGCGQRLKKFAGKVVRTGQVFAARCVAGAGKGEKGEDRIEG